MCNSRSGVQIFKKSDIKEIYKVLSSHLNFHFYWRSFTVTLNECFCRCIKLNLRAPEQGNAANKGVAARVSHNICSIYLSNMFLDQ
jgi:hypothetical protein